MNDEHLVCSMNSDQIHRANYTEHNSLFIAHHSFYPEPKPDTRLVFR